MQHAAPSSSRQRSPVYSDDDDSTLSSAGEGSTSSGPMSSAMAPSHSAGSTSSNTTAYAAKPQRPHLAQTHGRSGSFVRLKRKNTSPVTSMDQTRLHSNGQGLAHQLQTPTTGGNGVESGERTLDQIQTKTCFICYEEESVDPSTGPPSPSTGSSTRKKWIHPCKCALVAHEECLLSWIAASKPNTSSSKPTCCPQCNTPYTISQRTFPLLDLVESIEGVWRRNLSKLLMAGAGSGLWYLGSWYGAWAIRTFAGTQVADQLLMRRWTSYITAPLVAPVLILSSTNLLDSILPLLPLTLVLNSSLPSTSSASYLFDSYSLTELSLASFPPNPALTLCLMPWVRALYLALRRRVFRAVLGGRKPTPLASPTSPPNHTNNDNAEGAGGVNLPAAEDFIRNHARARHLNQNEVEGNGNAHGGEFNADIALLNGEAGQERRLVVTVSSGFRILAGCVLFPGIASLAGSALLLLARRQESRGSYWLAKFLGVGAASSAAAAASSSSNWIFSNFLPPQTAFTAYQRGVMQGIDPVWWRNAVGGAMVVLVKDVWRILRRTMERKRHESRRIENQSIRSGLEM